MKYIIITITIIISIILTTLITRAIEMKATVEPNEINTCVEVLRETGYLK
jgi:hypothetical protein